MKQKILLTFIESGFGHISSMESIYETLLERYPDDYEIIKSYLMHENEDLPHLARLEKFLVKEVQNTNKHAWFGDFTFFLIRVFGKARLLRLFHKKIKKQAFIEGLEAIKRRQPDVIVTNHYFTQMLAIEYKRTIDPAVAVVNYNPDCTLHSFWDNRDGIFVVNGERVRQYALKRGFKEERLRLVAPCINSRVEKCDKTREELREQFGLPKDKFTVTVADGGYFMALGPKFAREIIKSGLPITLCILAGANEERYEEFTAIAEGRGKIKPSDDMTIKVFRYLDNAYELYGAADVFLTKGGSLAMLDSMYMHTPLVINAFPHVIEKAAVREYIKTRHCGEIIKRPKQFIERVRQLMNDSSDLDKYNDNINKLIAAGNGITALVDIIDEEAKKQARECVPEPDAAVAIPADD